MSWQKNKLAGIHRPKPKYSPDYFTLLNTLLIVSKYLCVYFFQYLKQPLLFMIKSTTSTQQCTPQSLTQLSKCSLYE